MLQDLLLYGTNLELEDVPKLQKLLPQVTIDHRMGGLLGVGSTMPEGMGSAVIGIVKKGSAAEAAGIKVGDTVQRFEGQTVSNFKALTLMIGKHRAGDEVSLEVLRDGKPLDFKVKLDAWTSAN
jgi:S1-C subfamily serine protease